MLEVTRNDRQVDRAAGRDLAHAAGPTALGDAADDAGPRRIAKGLEERGVEQIVEHAAGCRSLMRIPRRRSRLAAGGRTVTGTLAAGAGACRSSGRADRRRGSGRMLLHGDASVALRPCATLDPVDEFGNQRRSASKHRGAMTSPFRTEPRPALCRGKPTQKSARTQPCSPASIDRP